MTNGLFGNHVSITIDSGGGVLAYLCRLPEHLLPTDVRYRSAVSFLDLLIKTSLSASGYRVHSINFLAAYKAISFNSEC